MKKSRKVAANTIIQVIGKIISAAISFVITILLARNYGPAGFGDFVKISTYIAFFYLIVDFGFNAIVLQYINKQPKRENFFLQNLLAMRGIFALFLTVVAVLIAVVLPFNKLNFYGFNNQVKSGIFILSFTILTQAVFVTINAIFQKDLRYDKAVIASFVGSVVNLVILLILLYFHSPLLLAIASFVVGDIFMVIASFKLVGIFKRLKYEAYIDFHLWRKLFNDALPLGLVLLFNLVYFRADTMILTFMKSTADVGIYGLAYKLFEAVLTLPIFFMNAVYPLILEARSKNYELKIFNKSILFLVCSSLFLVLCFWLLSPLLTFIKPEFGRSILPLRILSLSLPFFFLSTFFMWFLIAQKMQTILVKIYGSLMIINILLNLVFIPRYSYMAAATITGITELMVVLVSGAVSYKILKN